MFTVNEFWSISEISGKKNTAELNEFTVRLYEIGQWAVLTEILFLVFSTIQVFF